MRPCLLQALLLLLRQGVGRDGIDHGQQVTGLCADGIDLLLRHVGGDDGQIAVLLQGLPQLLGILGRLRAVCIAVLGQPADESIQLLCIHTHCIGHRPDAVLVGGSVGVQLGLGLGQLLFGGVQLRQPVIVLPEPGLVLGLTVLQLPAGSLQSGGVGGKLLLACLQLCLGGLQLRFGLGQLGRAVIEQRFVGRQLVQAVRILPLTVIDLALAVGQLLPAIGQLCGGICQLLVGLGLGIVVFSPGIVQLGAGLGNDAAVPRLAPGVGNALDPGLDGVHCVAVIIAEAVLRKGTLGGQVDLGVGLKGKILLRDVEYQLDCAVAHAGRLALKAEIVRVMHNAYNGVDGGVQLRVQRLVCAAYHQLGADGVGGVQLHGTGLDHALAGGRRQAALHKAETVDRVVVRRGQAVGAADDGVAVCLDQQIGRVARLHLAHAVHLPERGNILVSQAQSGDNAQIVEIGIIHIALHRLLHVDGGAVQPGQKAYAQRHDGKHGSKPAHGIFKCPQGVFAIAACHLPFNPFHRGGGGVHRLVNHAAAVDADDPVCHGGQRTVVGDDDDRAALPAAGGLQQRQHLLAGLVVQRAGGFIAEQDLRVFGQRAGNRNTLLLTARKLRREVVLSVRQSHLVQHGVGVQRVAADLSGQLDIFPRGQVLHQIVELKDKAHIIPAVGRQPLFIKAADLFAVQQDRALIAGVHAAQHIQHGGLACARGAEDDAELALFDLKADMVGRGDPRFTHLIIFTHIVKQHKRLRHAEIPPVRL